MKKLSFVLIFSVVFGFMAFADSDEQDEIDFLLFLPNSSDQFVNEEQAMIQLDKLAEYLTGRDLIPGQIHVYGYSAVFVNDIAPTDISMERALFVINELQKRGVAEDFFADPVAYGAVNLWGGNTGEEGRGPNRRVRILLDDVILTPATLPVADAEVEIPETEEVAAAEEEAVTVTPEAGKSKAKFPWMLLLLLLALIPAMLFLLFKLFKCGKETKAAAVVAPVVVPAPISYTIVNLDNEILLCAYRLYQQRNGQSEDAVWDWHAAVHYICDWYETDGYQTYPENGSWWAKRADKSA